MKIEFNPFEIPPAKLLLIARFLNDLAGGAKILGSIAADSSQGAEYVLGNAASTGGVEQATSSTSEQSSTNAPSASVDLTDLDKNGLPWDARIHSGAKGKNQDGSWKSLRNVNKDIVPGIEAELRALVANAGTLAPDASAADAPPPPPPPVAGADAPPPPPPVVAPDAPAADEITMAMAFKRLSQVTKEQQTMALELLEMKAPGEFLTANKTDPTVVRRMWDALIAVTGEE